MKLSTESEVLTQCWYCNDVQSHQLWVGYRPQTIVCHCGWTVEVLTVNGKPYLGVQSELMRMARGAP